MNHDELVKAIGELLQENTDNPQEAKEVIEEVIREFLTRPE